MSMHTPGPWKAAEREDRNGYLRIFSLSDAECAPALAYGDNKYQREANARLIAAAPEMLEALIGASETLLATYDILRDYELRAGLWEAYDLCQSAIKKARGD